MRTYEVRFTYLWKHDDIDEIVVRVYRCYFLPLIDRWFIKGPKEGIGIGLRNSFVSDTYYRLALDIYVDAVERHIRLPWLSDENLVTRLTSED